MSDQMHCFEIRRNSGGSWVSADTKCSEVGGFLAHIDNSSLYTQLENYVVTNYQKPLMTGATVANTDLELVALMCPSNTFYSLLSNSFVASSFNGTPGDGDRCTFFTNDKSSRLHYMPCNTSADVLCDRPMEKKNYCNIMMNCTTTTTSTTTTSSTTTTPSTTTSSTTVTTPKANTTTTSITSTHSTPSTTKNSSTTTTPRSNATSAATTNTTTSTHVSTPTVTTAKTTPSTAKTTTTPFQVPITTTTASTNICFGSGYTRVFGWCVPWWCWLIFGLLLLGLLLCFLSWLCHFCNSACLCSHHPEKAIAAPEPRITPWARTNAACQTDPFLLPKGETVYVPVPKTPPPEREKIVIKEIEKPPVHTHTVLHTREVVRDSTPAPVVNNLTVYENAFNKHTVIVPPAVQQPEVVPTIFLPPPTMDFDHDIINAPTPQITEDIPDSVVPFLPLSEPNKPQERPFSPLKHNKPPIGGFMPRGKPIKVGPGEITVPSPRAFPKRPSSVGNERDFPKQPSDSPPMRPKQRSVTPPEFDRPIRKNTPLGEPEPLSQNPLEKQANPYPPTRSPKKNSSNKIPRNENPDSQPFLRSYSPPLGNPSPKPPSTRRVSPMNDSPTKIPSSPRKFPSPPSPELSKQSLTAPMKNPNVRRRSPLPQFEDSDEGVAKDSANIRPARGRLGGAVHGRPEGWKPWPKNSNTFSSHPGFLD